VVGLDDVGVAAAVRRPIATLAALLAGAVALVGPAIAERSALRALRQGVARCPGERAIESGEPAGGWGRGIAAALGTTSADFAHDGPQGSSCGGIAKADVDVEGLRLWHPWREHAGMRVEADELSVTVDGQGVQVDATALRVGRAVATTPRPAPSGARRTGEDPGVTRAQDSRPRRPPLHTRGVPVHVRAHGPVTGSVGGVEVTVDAPRLHLDGHGGATATFGLALEGRGLRAAGVGRWTATVLDHDPRRIAAEGAVVIGDGPVATATVRLTTDRAEATLRDGAGGRLSLAALRPATGRVPAAIHVEAERFALATLGSLGARTLGRWGLRPEGVRVDAALEVSGLAAAEREVSARIERLVIDGLVVDHRKLARTPVELDALELHGDVQWHGDAAAGQLWLAHRQARLALTAQVGPAALDLRAELAPLPCQALLDAFPVAMSEMVAGTRLEGELTARAELHLDRTALAGARDEAEAERVRRRSSEPSGRRRARAPEAPPPPGRIDFAFPFLERCRVVADDPRLDLAALSGPYRHRFVANDGGMKERVMAPGAPGYVSLHQVPLVARAFVVLEDRRFWEHDGFDREQIEGALWHNLAQGRVSRGASTISQQAARNLWLGVDRSWGRKLQEALLTARLEASTGKARIMELYLNVIELGPGTHGVDEAARLYFGKPAAQLSVLQAIHLAALAPAPQRLAERFVDGRVDAQWLDMLREHVRRMHRAGHISEAQMVGALRDELRLLDRREPIGP
jgi:hypothetical protein